MTKERIFTLGFHQKTVDFQGQMVPNDTHESDEIEISVLSGGIPRTSRDGCCAFSRAHRPLPRFTDLAYDWKDEHEVPKRSI